MNPQYWYDRNDDQQGNYKVNCSRVEGLQRNRAHQNSRNLNSAANKSDQLKPTTNKSTTDNQSIHSLSSHLTSLSQIIERHLSSTAYLLALSPLILLTALIAGVVLGANNNNNCNQNVKSGGEGQTWTIGNCQEGIIDRLWGSYITNRDNCGHQMEGTVDGYHNEINQLGRTNKLIIQSTTEQFDEQSWQYSFYFRLGIIWTLGLILWLFVYHMVTSWRLNTPIISSSNGLVMKGRSQLSHHHHLDSKVLIPQLSSESHMDCQVLSDMLKMF